MKSKMNVATTTPKNKSTKKTAPPVAEAAAPATDRPSMSGVRSIAEDVVISIARSIRQEFQDNTGAQLDQDDGVGTTPLGWTVWALCDAIDLINAIDDLPETPSKKSEAADAS